MEVLSSIECYSSASATCIVRKRKIKRLTTADAVTTGVGCELRHSRKRMRLTAEFGR